MTVSYISSGTTVYSTGNPLPLTPTHNIADMLVVTVGTKPDTTPPTTPEGWIVLGSTTGGTGTLGIDTGPMRVDVFTREADGSALDNTGAITVTGNSVSAAQVHVFRKTGAAWDIGYTGAADTTTGTSFSAVMPVNPGLTVGDILLAVGVIPTDVTTPSQFSAESVSATGMTTVTLTEIVEWDTASGEDMGGWVGWGSVATGTATDVPTVTSTAGGTTTNVAGPIALIRLREVSPTPISGTDTSSIAISETSSVQVMLDTTDTSSVAISDSSSVTVGTVDIAQRDTTTTNSGSDAVPFVAKPTGTVATDIVILTVASSGGGIFTPPTGFSPLYDTTTAVANPKSHVCYRICDGSEGANFTGALSTAVAWSAEATTLSGVDNTTPWATAVTANEYSTGVVSSIAPNVPAGAPGRMLIGGAAGNSSTVTFTPPTGWIELCDLGVGKSQTLAIFPDAFGTGSASPTFTLSASRESEAWSGALNPATASTPISGTDSASIAISEAKTLDGSSTSADTSSISISETSQSQSTLSATDTSSIAIADSSSLTIFVDKSASDTSSISIADLSTVAILNVLSASDTSTITITDASLVAASLSASDTASVSITESKSILTTVSVTDSFAISIAEAKSLNGSSTSTDTASVAVSEATAITVALSATDTSAITVSETSSVSGTMSATDTGSVAIADSSSTTMPLSTTDTSAISISEATDTVVGGVTDKSGTDTASIAISEGSSVVQVSTASDTNGLHIDETAAVSSTSARTESAAISIAETTAILVTLSATDTSSITISESATQAILTSKSAVDTASISVNETAIIAGTVSASDTGTISVLEETAAFVQIGSQDGSAISISEQSDVVDLDALPYNVFASDESSISISEFRKLNDPDAPETEVNIETTSDSSSGGFASNTESAIINHIDTSINTNVRLEGTN